MDREDPTSRAADLAEDILDQVSTIDQDWRAIAESARELAELADRVVASPDS